MHGAQRRECAAALDERRDRERREAAFASGGGAEDPWRRFHGPRATATPVPTVCVRAVLFVSLALCFALYSF